MHRMYECVTKARLSFCGGPQAPANMADRVEEVNVSMKNVGGTFASCAIFLTPSFQKSLKFFGTSIASLDPETVQLTAFSIHVLSAMFTRACGPPEQLSLALVQRSKVLRMIVKLAYW